MVQWQLSGLMDRTRPRPRLTGPRTLAATGTGSGCTLDGARHCLRAAMQAIESCDVQVRGHIEARRYHDEDVPPVILATLTTELAEARNEAAQLRREVQRFRGMPADLSALSTVGLHALQQELSQALRNVHGELESRTKCCVCREAERQVLLRPCQHFALCSDCAGRLSKCPLCRSTVECYETICVS